MFWGYFEIYLISSSFSHYEQKCGFTLGEKFSVGLSNCYVSTGTFWGELFLKRTKTISYRLPVFERTFFGPLATKIWQVRQKWIPRVQRNNCGLFRKRYTFFISFGVWVKNCQLFGSKFSAGLSKRQSECPRSILRGNYIFEKSIFSFWPFLDFEQFF